MIALQVNHIDIV